MMAPTWDMTALQSEEGVAVECHHFSPNDDNLPH